jgi:MinD-like ATPase involved in chromosome partitioning or flagellar assembly
MAKIVAVHSFRHGTGKSSLAVNLAVLMAVAGKRVGIIDAALKAPSAHILLGVNEADTRYTLNDYLWGDYDIDRAVHNVSARLNADLQGQVFLVPAREKVDQAFSKVEMYAAERLAAGVDKVVTRLALDIVFLDTSGGMQDDALLPLAISDTLLEILRLDQQDYQGTAVVMDLARKLNIPLVLLVVNIVSQSYNEQAVVAEIEQNFGHEVAALVPVSEEMLALREGNIFVLSFPQHPITLALQQLAGKLS